MKPFSVILFQLLEAQIKTQTTPGQTTGSTSVQGNAAVWEGQRNSKDVEFHFYCRLWKSTRRKIDAPMNMGLREKEEGEGEKKSISIFHEE